MPVPTLESRKHSQRRGRLYEAREAFATPRPAGASHAGPQEPSPHLWGLILAGGDGQRLQPLIKAWYGHARPKQYCTFFGGHSLLRQTLARVERLIPAAHLLTVVTQAHMIYVRKELCDRAPETVIIQPCNRETGAGILLPLLHIVHRDPEAIVALFPSDHFIREEARFMAAVATAVASLATHPRHLVLLGMAPEGPEREYGWIARGDILEQVSGQAVYRVQQFWEKPTLSVAEGLYRRQALWNTMVLVGHARVVLTLFQTLTPALYGPFAPCRESWEALQDLQVLHEVYATLPVVSFSRAILTQSAPCLGVLPVHGVHWSDWGSPARVMQDLVRYQLWRPARAEVPPRSSCRWS
jgi:mannose-1-phosphate guanylyltransferase